MELLAPAGNWDAFLAAMKNGADAVYLGGKSYSARQSADNFDLEHLEEAVNYAHLRNRKVYVTVNTLIDNGEFSGALDYLYELQQRQVDAVIVQDIGLATASRQVLPGLRLHASTQMTVHNADGVAFCREQGIKRVVLARELSRTDIKLIHEQVEDAELEVFVHGALCYSYSGQCLFSSMVGGRSGNRGRCAQPCRLAYELVNHSGQRKIDPAAQGKHLLSPADLCLIDYLPELRESGVNSLKIEGRMKRAEYVAVVCRAYREALDLLEDNARRPAPELKEKLLKIFNRRFSTGYFLDSKNDFLSTRRPNNRGVFTGRIVEQSPDLLTTIKLSDRVQQGDGLVVWVGRAKNPVVILNDFYIGNQQVNTAKANELITVPLDERVYPGDRVFKTHDEQLLAEAQQSIQEEEAHKLVVDAQVSMQLGQPLHLVLQDDQGNRSEAQTENVAQEARKYALTEEVLRDKLGRLGNTHFVLRDLTINGADNLMIPFSDLNEVRRQAIDELITRRLQSHRQPVVTAREYSKAKQQVLAQAAGSKNTTAPLLTVAVNSVEQARLALDQGADRVLLGLEGIGTRKRPSKIQLQELLSWNNRTVCSVIPVLPRIHLPGEMHSYRDIIDQGFTSLMVGNWGDLYWGLQQGAEIMADYSLNVFNMQSLQFLLNLGLGTVCLSPELNFNQLHSFRDFAKVEILIHGELMLMESQHCMLGSTLGATAGKCAVCSQDKYCLQDEKGYQFPVATDADCRFYVFNSRTMCIIEDLERVINQGPQSIRIEARLYNDAELSKTVKIYRQAVDGLLAGKELDLSACKAKLAEQGRSFTKAHYYRGVL